MPWNRVFVFPPLEKHGRISNNELAACVGLSPSPCPRRVRRLEQTGVIRGYQALVDPAAVGRGLRVFAGVRLIRHARADVVACERAVIRLPEVIHTHHITGNYDYLLQVEVADLPAYAPPSKLVLLARRELPEGAYASVPGQRGRSAEGWPGKGPGPLRHGRTA